MDICLYPLDLCKNILKLLVEKDVHFYFIFRFCLKIKYLIILAEILLCCEEIPGDREIKVFKFLMNLHNVCDVPLRQIQLVL